MFNVATLRLLSFYFVVTITNHNTISHSLLACLHTFVTCKALIHYIANHIKFIINLSRVKFAMTGVSTRTSTRTRPIYICSWGWSLIDRSIIDKLKVGFYFVLVSWQKTAKNPPNFNVWLKIITLRSLILLGS